MIELTVCCGLVADVLDEGAVGLRGRGDPCRDRDGIAVRSAKTTFGPASCVGLLEVARLVTMNESFGADGNSWTTPTTWKGTTRKRPVARSRRAA